MGFTNTIYKETLNTLVQGRLNRLQNPFYKWIDKKPTIVTYWNMNTKMSSLDEGRRDNYDQLGDKSPLRYNRIDDFVLYGIQQIQIEINTDEFGPSAPDIEGEALILPNTIIPSADDYFTISYLQGPYLFRVTRQTIDTFENGQNFYKITYILDMTGNEFINKLNSKQTIKRFKFKIENVGTNSTCLLTDADDSLISLLSKLYNKFRRYYIELFWRANIQTFVYGYCEDFIYDGYLIEFLIRNNIFAADDNNEYLYLAQATHTNQTFNIEYDNTIFKDFEEQNHYLHTNSCYACHIHDPNSLLIDRLEEYKQLSINKHDIHFSDPINWLNMNLFDHIEQNSLFNEEDESNHKLYWNIFINWCNQGDNFEITSEELNSLDKLKIKYSKDLFYEIPLLLFIIKSYIGRLQQTTDTTSITEEANKYLEKCYNVKK